MTSAFESALREVEREVGAGASSRILRTELRDDGTIVLTLEEGSAMRWFVHAADMLREIEPGSESRVPAARELAALCAAGNGEMLSWRPGRRMVVHVLARDGAHVVKAHRSGRALPAARRHEALRTAQRCGFRVPRVLFTDTRQETIAFDVVAGDLPRADDLWCFQRVGRLLRALQGCTPQIVVEDHDRARELNELDRHARRFADATQGLPAGWLEARASLAGAVASARRPLVVAHRDLHDGQILVDGTSIALLDWDQICRAEPELDCANLAVHMRLAGWLGTGGVDARGTDAAIEALRDGHGGLDERVERFYVATTALRLALVHGVRPRARAALAPLVELAREAASRTCRA